LNVNYIWNFYSIDSGIKTSVSGYGVSAEGRYYFETGERYVMKGFYGSVWLRYRDLLESEDDGYISTGQDGPGQHSSSYQRFFSYKLNQYAAGIMFGYSYNHGDGFDLDIFGGPCYNINNYTLLKSTDSNDIYHPGRIGNTGIGFRFGIGIGYKF
jgi:hypothetical protein